MRLGVLEEDRVWGERGLSWTHTEWEKPLQPLGGNAKYTAGVQKTVLGNEHCGPSVLTHWLEPRHGENGLGPWRESQRAGRWVWGCCGTQ